MGPAAPLPEPSGPGLRQLLPFLPDVERAADDVPDDATLAPEEVLAERRFPTRRRSSASGSTTAPTPRRPGSSRPPRPTFFAKFRNALVPAGAHGPAAGGSQKVDYEAEVAFVVGRARTDVPEDEALDHVAGYTLLNDLSARDLQFATPQWMPGKVFDGSAPCGPALVTPDEAGPHDAIEFALTLNGETMQEASTADLIFSIPALVAHLSRLMTLEPGDIVSTGTPAGVGSAREPRVWLEAGRRDRRQLAARSAARDDDRRRPALIARVSGR